MEEPVVALGAAAAAMALLFAGASWSALRSGRPLMRALSATVMVGMVGLWALFLLFLAFKSLWGFDHPVGDWAVSPQGEHAAVAIQSTDDSGDHAWDVAVIAPGALSRVTFRFEGVAGGEQAPVLRFPTPDHLVIDDRLHPVRCRIDDEVAAVTEQLQQLMPKEATRFKTRTSDCGNRVSAAFTSPSAKQACRAISRKASQSGWSVKQPHRMCPTLVTPQGVSFEAWLLDRRTVVVNETYPRADQGFTSFR